MLTSATAWSQFLEYNQQFWKTNCNHSLTNALASISYTCSIFHPNTIFINSVYLQLPFTTSVSYQQALVSTISSSITCINGFYLGGVSFMLTCATAWANSGIQSTILDRQFLDHFDNKRTRKIFSYTCSYFNPVQSLSKWSISNYHLHHLYHTNRPFCEQHIISTQTPVSNTLEMPEEHSHPTFNT